MTTIFEDLGKRESSAVIDALTRKCRVCHAPKGDICTELTNGFPLHNRLVHFDRVGEIHR